MLYALGVLIFAFGLLASIALHEVGHMVPAKRFGVLVTQYMVGFGPTVFSRRKGDTEYGVKAVPLGGYIRMIGMVPPAREGRRFRWPRRMASAVEEFRAQSRSEVTPEAESRQFYRLTPGKKMIVMFGGPFMNFVIYLVLTVALALSLGQKHEDVTTTVSSVSQCVLAATDPQAQTDTCPSNAKTAPAKGKLYPGDVLTAVNGAPVTSWQDAVSVIEKSADIPVDLTVKRDGKPVDVTVTPIPNTKYANEDGSKTKIAGFIGVSPQIHDYYQAVPVAKIPGQIVSQIAQGVDVLKQYPQRIASVWQTVFDGKARDPEGAVGVVGIGRLDGEVVSNAAFGMQDKIFILVSLLASVNLLLFFFNLLPLLPLDGGHIAGALLESIKRGRARLRERQLVGAMQSDAGGDDAPPRPARTPIYVDTAQMLPVIYGVAGFLVLVTLLITYADIVKPIHIGG